MCDPGSLISAGVGAGTRLADGFGKQAAAQKQQEANKNHAMMQLMLMQQHLQNQNRMRGQSQGAWSAGLDDMGAASQIARQSQEEARLGAYLNGDTQPVFGSPQASSMGVRWWEEQPVNNKNGLPSYSNAPPPNTTVVAPPANSGEGFSFDPGIAGSAQGGDVFQSDLARKLNTAAREARGQINSLARLSSYGGSYGGLGTVNPMILGNSANAIDMWNNFRRGDLRVYDVERQIPAAQYQYKSSPLMALGGLLGAGAKGLGSAAAGFPGGGIF